MKAGNGDSAQEGVALRWRFNELKSTYNFRHPSTQADVFLDFIGEEAARASAPVKAIDIGCGRGMALDPEKTRRARRLVDELWGVEPDTRVEPIEGVFANFQHATVESADLPPASFDFAYSRMVMEHVEDPVSFFRAVHRALKPGGTYLFMTVNGRHYFAKIARLLSALRLEDAVLKVLLGKRGSAYHYPVAYKCNRPRDIERLCGETGFEPPEFVFIERKGPVPYFPGPLKPILHAMNLKRDLIQRPDSLLELIGRVRKPF